MQIQAAVLRAIDQPYRLEPVELPDPGPDEVLVRIVGVGMCHTDVLLRAPGFASLPVIAGHEGSGVVEAVGRDVASVDAGDHVVLTFDSCGRCDSCVSARPHYCDTFVPRNLVAQPVARDASGEPVSAGWFRQSSFATHALATARNVVKVDRDLPLELFGPLGCGVQTGAGAVLNALRVHPGSSIAVFGAGTVGLSAIMAARIAGATTIVAVDLHESRLKLASELGATHVLRAGAELPLPVDYGIDTTGVPSVIRTAIGGLRIGGVLGLIAMQLGDLTLGPLDLGVGRTLMGIVESHAVPQQFIPRLIALWRQDRFPFDRLIRTYPLSEINEAGQAAHSGDVIKPVLLPG